MLPANSYNDWGGDFENPTPTEFVLLGLTPEARQKIGGLLFFGGNNYPSADGQLEVYKPLEFDESKRQLLLWLGLQIMTLNGFSLTSDAWGQSNDGLFHTTIQADINNPGHIIIHSDSPTDGSTSPITSVQVTNRDPGTGATISLASGVLTLGIPSGLTGSQGSAGSNGTNGTNGTDGITPQFRVQSGYIQVSIDNGATWNNLIALSSITGPQGDPGTNGTNGTDGIVNLIINLIDSSLDQSGSLASHNLTLNLHKGVNSAPKPDVRTGETNDIVACNMAAGVTDWLFSKCSDALNQIKLGIDNSKVFSDIVTTVISILSVGTIDIGPLSSFVSDVEGGSVDVEEALITTEFKAAVKCYLYCILQAQNGPAIEPGVIDEWVNQVKTYGTQDFYTTIFPKFMYSLPLNAYGQQAYITAHQIGNCASCGCGPWSSVIDLSASNGNPIVTSNPQQGDTGLFRGAGNWVSGSGWQTNDSSAYNNGYSDRMVSLLIQFTYEPGITSITVHYDLVPGHRSFGGYFGTVQADIFSGNLPTGTNQSFTITNPTTGTFYFSLDPCGDNGGLDGSGVLKSIEVHGTGTKPPDLP